MRLKYPKVMAFAIPNGFFAGKNGVAHAVRMKAEGMMKGVPDYWIICPSHCGSFCGLVIEFKANTNKPSVEQRIVVADAVEEKQPPKTIDELVASIEAKSETEMFDDLPF